MHAVVALAFLFLGCAPGLPQTLDPDRSANGPAVCDLRLESAMRALRRLKRDADMFAALGPFGRAVNKTRSPRSSVVVLEAAPHAGDAQNGGRCVLSADQAVQFCGFAEEVSAPPIPPPEAGACHLSTTSGREICYPRYEQLDTTCTDAGGDRSALVAPPVISHATVRTMAFVPPDNLNRLIRQYYRQQGRHLHRNESVFDVENARSFLFVKYHCEYGYEMLDEADTMFCQNKQWVQTKPVCRGKGLCEKDNGGCSHSCLSLEDRTMECRCPKGLILDSDQKTCIKPVPKNLCRKLAGCRCSPIDVNVQYACSCQNEEQKCLLMRGPPKVYLEPSPPFEVEPGGKLNITCAAAAFPFPRIYWQRGNEEINGASQKQGAVKSEQVLMIKEIYKNTEYTCHAENEVGATKRVITVVVTGPGSAPIIRAVNAARTSIETSWDPPHIQNRPITYYDIHFTDNPLLPLRDWQRETVQEPAHKAVMKSLKPDTIYTIRIRASDSLGPGKLSNPVSITTQNAAKRPAVHIVEGEEFRVAPKTPFTLGCNVTRGDPTPSVQWESRGRAISTPQERRFVSLEHVGLYESTKFQCVAENEAGKTTREINVTVTGPTAPERIRYHIAGDQVLLQWEPPRITNGPMKDYEVLYTDDPSRPETEWRAVNSGGPDATSVALTNLREMTDYTIKVRGENENGVGLPSLDFTVKTWLAPRKPAAQLTPADEIRQAPSTNELTIVCNADGVPRPRIVWLWDGVPVDDGNNGFRVYDVTPIDAMERTQSKLQAQNATRTGRAQCQAINKHGVDSKDVSVKILGPGSAPEVIQPTAAQDGFHVNWTIPTVPNGNINKYVIYYTKNPDQDLADWSTTTVDGNTTSATVPNQEEDTPYVVRLQAVNDDGPGIISDSYEVTTGQKHIPLAVSLVVTDPKRLADPSDPAGTLVEPHQVIRFKCAVEGRPKPTVFYTWLPFNDTESGQEPVHLSIEPRPTPHSYESEVAETSTTTRRSLRCEARNVHGSAEDSHVFNVLKPGTPPVEITHLVDLDNKVTINWKPTVHPNGNVNKYNVYLSADPSKPLREWKKFDAEVAVQPSIEFKRGDLEPETPYYVRIAAVNDDGEGVPSDVIHFMTQSGAPLDAPTDVLAEVAPDNTVNISWTGPSQTNGPLKSYTVYFTPEDPGELEDDMHKWTKVVIDTPDPTGRVTLDKNTYNLLPDHDYRVRVSATNDQSEGPLSGVVRFTTGNGEVAPTIALSSSENPVSVPPLGEYTANCSASGVPPPAVFWTVGESNHVPGPILHVGPLTRDTTATCVAENNAGKAQQTLNIHVAGPGTPPNEIVSIPMINPENGGQEVNVEWTAPNDTNGKITNYIVHYGIVPDGELEPIEWQQADVEPNKDKLKLPDLLPKSKYQVKVQAVSDRGPGVLSPALTVTTLPIPPRAVEPPRVVVHDNNTVQLEFKPVDDPSDPTGKTKIKDYKIIYTTGDPQLEDTKWKEMVWTLPDDDLTDAQRTGVVIVPIDGENFDPETGYTVKLIPRGEIDGLPTDPVVFQTSDGIIPPDMPVINVALPPNNTIRVPAGADYTVSCTANGFPAPNVTWTDGDGRRLSDSAMLRLFDIKTSQRTKCVAQNVGGTAETPLTIYVTGPGTSPENIRLTANKPKTIDVRWNPPTIPNGNVTRYIIYYTPLDDQDRVYQVGQIPSKPISEWLTYHVIDKDLGEGEKHAALTDFVASDTAYAVVLQAVNEDGPGPYSEQHSIRTMSKVREQPPKELRVEPLNQTSARVRWRPAEGADQVAPTAYELYYIVGDRKIEEDEFLSLPKWTKVDIPDGETLSHDILNALAPDTEYVFKIRAIYDSGPGVFSKPCITKTLPQGDVPFIVVSAGAGGIAGTTEVDVLPGSAYNVFCKASGRPLPSVKWIRAGSTPIDPSTVRSEDSSTKWSLNVANITEDATFICEAQNQIGVANWTIRLNVVEVSDLPPNWESGLVAAENRNGDIVLSFSDKIPEYLKNSNNWVFRYTDDPTKPIDTWNVEESGDRPLKELQLADLEPGTTYHVAIENPTDGVRSPIVSFVVPKPPSDIHVVPNIDNDIIVGFRPAISTTPIEKYTIRYWPKTASPEDATTIEVSSNSTTGNVIRDLPLDTEHNFQVTAYLSDGKTLTSDTISITTPADEVKCDCSHFCRLVENEAGKVVRVQCSCPDKFQLSEDEKTCLPIENEGDKIATVQVSSTFNPLDVLDKPKKLEESTLGSSPLPTDPSGRYVTVTNDQTISPHPTDELGRVIYPVAFFNGTWLPTDASHVSYNQLGRPIERDEDQNALGPNGEPLKRDEDGNFIYPPLDKFQQPLPTDANFRPIYRVAKEDGIEFPQDSNGRSVDKQGAPFPTDSNGQPVAPDGSPLPTDYYGRFVILATDDDDIPTVLPTDAMGYPIYQIIDSDDRLLPTAATGAHVNEDGDEIERNDQGIPLDQYGNELKKDSNGRYIWPAVGDKTQRPLKPDDILRGNNVPTTTKAPTTISVVKSDGRPQPTNAAGHFLGLDERPLPTDSQGRPLGPDGETPLERNEHGAYVYVASTSAPTSPQSGKDAEGTHVSVSEEDTTIVTPRKLPTDDYSRLFRVVDEDGQSLTTDSTGRYVTLDGQPIDTDEFERPIDANSGVLLPKNHNGDYVYRGTTTPIIAVTTVSAPVPMTTVETTAEEVTTMTTPIQKPTTSLTIVNLNGKELPRDSNGQALFSNGDPIPTDSSGHYLDDNGAPVTPNSIGEIVVVDRRPTTEPSTSALPMTALPSVVIFDHGTDQLLPTDSNGRFLDADHQVILTDEYGRPLDEHQKILPTNSKGEYIYRKPDSPLLGLSTPSAVVVGSNGEPLPTNADGKAVGLDGELLPTNQQGVLVGSDGHPLPTNSQGQVVLKTATAADKTLPTDQSGRVINPIVSEDNRLLKQDEHGRYIDFNENQIPVDDIGRPLNDDGDVLPTNADGIYVYKRRPEERLVGTKQIKSVIDTNGQPLPTNSDGEFVDADGNALPTNGYGDLVDADGSPLPISSDGVIQLEAKAKKLSTDDYGKLIYPVVGPDGTPLQKDDRGNYVDTKGEAIPIDDFGRPLDGDGTILPTNSDGDFVYVQPEDSKEKTPTPLSNNAVEVTETTAEAEITTSTPSDRSAYRVVSPNGSPLPQSEPGKFVNAKGETIETDEKGRPLDAGGDVLPTNSKGEYVYTNPNKAIVVGPDDEPLPTVATGGFVDWNGDAIPTNSIGDYLDSNGALLPTNGNGDFVFVPESKGTQPPTDASGKVVHPIVDSYGIQLPIDGFGRHVDPDGNQIPTDDFGKPLDDSGAVLPTDDSGRFIYVRLTTAVPSTTRRTIIAVGPDGLPIPTDYVGNVVDRNGSPYPTNTDGLLIGPDGSPLPTNADGASIVRPDSAATDRNAETKILPTDTTGKVIHPVVGEDGELLPTDGTGHFVGIGGEEISFDNQGRPLNGDGAILPTNSDGEFVYSGLLSTIKPIDPWDYDSESTDTPMAYPKDSDSDGALSKGQKCQLRSATADVIIALNNELLKDVDSERSIKLAIERLIRLRLDLAPEYVRIAILQYGRGAQVPVNLGGYHERDEVAGQVRRLTYSQALGAPEIQAAYRAAAQQYRSFGRKKAGRLVIAFTDGEDIGNNRGRHSLGAASVILVGLRRYDTEIQDESRFHVLVDEWNVPQLALKIVRYVETQCRDGNLRLTSASAFTAAPVTVTTTQQSAFEPEEIIIDETKKSDQQEKCEKLQTRTRLILVVETSDTTEPQKGVLKRLLFNFLRNYVEKTGTSLRIGIIYYGKTAEVPVDIGNYQNIAELEEAIQDMYFVGGAADAALALRTARHLFDEQRDKDAAQDEGLWKTESSEAEKKEKDAKEKAETEKIRKQEIKIVFHVHSTTLSAEAIGEAEKNRREIGAAIINFDEAKWRLLESAESFWRSQICLMQSMVETSIGREDAAAASGDMLSDAFFRAGPDASPLPTDDSGRIVVPSTEEPTQPAAGSETARVLPTDESGKFVYPVVNEDGVLLSTDDSGRYVDALGDPVQTDDFGRPVDERGEILPVNRDGVHVLTGSRGNRLPSAKPTTVYGGDVLVIGADGVPMPTDALGNFIDADNRPLPTDASGFLVDAVGSPLPTNAQRQIVVGRDSGAGAANQALPTDDNGRFIYPVVYANGKPLQTDDNGRYVDANRETIPTDDFGRPLDEDGNLLPTNKYGQYIYPYTERPLLRTTARTTTWGTGRSSTVVIGPDGLPVATDESRRLVDEFNRPLPTNAVGQVVVVDAGDEDRYDKLATDSSGKVVYPIVDENGALLKTDSNGRHLNENDEPIELDESGRPVDRYGNVFPQNANGRYIYVQQPREGVTPAVAIGPDGLPLATDSAGQLIDHLGRPYPTDFSGRLIGPHGSPLPTNSQGEYIVLPEEDEPTARTLPTDDYGRNIYPVVDGNGHPLPTNHYGQHLTSDNETIATNEFGHPVGDDGEILTTNSRGEYIYSGPTAPSVPHDRTLGAVGADGRLLPTESNGIVLDDRGSTYPTNANGLLIDVDGSPLPTNADGKYVVDVDNGASSEVKLLDKDRPPLPTDEYGKIIYPIVHPDGNLLPKDESGRYVDARGEIISVDDFGRPLSGDGQPLPTNSLGDFVYADRSGTTSYNVVGPDNQPLPTDLTGRHLTSGGQPLSKDASGRPLDADGLPLPVNSNGEFMFDETKPRKKVPAVGPDGRPFPTDPYGNIIGNTAQPPVTTRIMPDHSPQTIGGAEVTLAGTADIAGEYQTVQLPTDAPPQYRIIDQDGIPLAKNSKGQYVDSEGVPISLDQWSRPLDRQGVILPQDAEENYVYGGVQWTTDLGSYDENIETTDTITPTEKTPYTVVNSDGHVLPRNEQGRFVTVDAGDPIPIDEYGRPVDAVTGRLLPQNSAGDYIYSISSDSALPTTSTTDNSEELTKLQKENDEYLAQRRNGSAHCFLGGFIEMLLVVDASSNVKILDYRLMKEAARDFLVDAFDLRAHHVRVGLIKYGEQVEVPVALGDYDNENELLSRLGETRRLKGAANLGNALRESASEFILSGSQADPPPPRFIIMWKNGNSTGKHVTDAAETLRNNFNAKLFVITVADSSEDIQIVGEDHPERIVRIRQWRGLESEELGRVVDHICQLAPEAMNPNPSTLWPTRRTSTTTASPATDIPSSLTCQSIDYKMDVIITLDSSNFDAQQFATILEGVGTLVDESFDLAPDVVRIGFIVYSDKVSVPVALGHYEDKIELLNSIVGAEKLTGSAIALRGLEAARQQFQLHGRERDEETGDPVARVVLFITNGKHRGNAASAAQEMRDKMDVQIFAVAVNPSEPQYASLSRIVGQENAAQRLLQISSVNDLTGDRLAFVRRQLCARISSAAAAASRTTKSLRAHQRHTVKRDVTHAAFNTKFPLDSSENKPTAICKDGLLRPYLITVVIDATSRASHKDFKAATNILAEYLKKKFGVKSPLLRLNFITVDSSQLLYAKQDIAFGEFTAAMRHMKLGQTASANAAKLDLAVKKARKIMKEQFIAGVNQLTIVLSADGLSSDLPAPLNNDANHVIALSVKNPSTDLLKNLSGGSSTRVIHFSNWTASNVEAQFDRWLSFAICGVVFSLPSNIQTGTTTTNIVNADKTRSYATDFSTRPPKWKSAKKIHVRQPSNFILTPISATALAVSWTCCSDQNDDYVIIYSPDASLPKRSWRRLNASCADAYGVIIDELPTHVNYHACVLFAKSTNDSYGSENCDAIYLSPESVAPGTNKFLDDEKTKRNVKTRQMEATIKQKISEVPKKCDQAGLMIDAHGNCIDIDECSKENGGCSHGCINTHGGYYCGCPHGMMRDPVDPKSCIKVTGSFERITELLMRYFHANKKSSEQPLVGGTSEAQPTKMKVSVQSTDDSKKLDFEWTTGRLRHIVKRALDWH